MEENSLTIAILKEIRDNTAQTNVRLDHLTGRVDHLTGRVDHLTDRVGALEDLSQTMAAVQIRQEAILQRLVAQGEEHTVAIGRLVAQGEEHTVAIGRLIEQGEEHTEAIRKLIKVTDRTSARLDNLFDGPLVSTVRDHEARIRRLEGRDD